MTPQENNSNKHYLQLITSVPLDSNQSNNWLYAIEEYGPEGIIKNHKVEKKKNKKETQFKHWVWLTRHLHHYETEIIVAAWDHLFNDDYEIESSYEYDDVSSDISDVEYETDADTIDHIREAVSRHLHNRWVDHKVSEGWRYGIGLSLNEKTHPSLQNWDSLPESYRKRVDISDDKLIEIFDRKRNLFL